MGAAAIISDYYGFACGAALSLPVEECCDTVYWLPRLLCKAVFCLEELAEPFIIFVFAMETEPCECRSSSPFTWSATLISFMTMFIDLS